MSIKSLGKLSKNLHKIDQNGTLLALKRLNENSVNLFKEEIKLILEINNKKEIYKNQSLNPFFFRNITTKKWWYCLGRSKLISDFIN